MASDPNVKIKKVKPYPFDVNLEKGDSKGRVFALKLVLHGIMVDMNGMILKVGDRVNMTIFLPADFGEIKADGKVIKTYDHFKGSQEGSAPVRMAEIHFLRYPLPEVDRLKVKDFLKAIRQMGPGSS